MGSERATVGPGNLIVTYEERTHVVWQDATPQGYFNRVRSLDRKTGAWSETVNLGRVLDNHARPVINVDHQGYLHVILGGHNTAMTYRRSTRPNDSSEWTKPEPAGEGTYAAMICGADDALYLTMRAKNHGGLDLYLRPPAGKWQAAVRLIARAKEYSGYAGYINAMAWGADGTMHMVSDFYEGHEPGTHRGMHQAVCYMRSRDAGKNWEKADGTPITLPARPEQMDILARDTHPRGKGTFGSPVILGNCGIVVDSKNVPHILYTSHLGKPGQIILTAPDAAGHWNQQPLVAATEQYPGMRAGGGHTALSITQDDTLHALLSLTPIDSENPDKVPSREARFNVKPDRRLVSLTWKAGDSKVNVRSVLEPGSVFNQARQEIPMGANINPAGKSPAIIYFDGTERYPKQGEVINNKVYWIGPQ